MTNVSSTADPAGAAHRVSSPRTGSRDAVPRPRQQVVVRHRLFRRLSTGAAGLVVEAHCPADGLIEAIRRPGGSFMAAVQWHPEFHRRAEGTLDDTPMLNDFLAAAARAQRRARRDAAGFVPSTTS